MLVFGKPYLGMFEMEEIASYCVSSAAQRSFVLQAVAGKQLRLFLNLEHTKESYND